MRPPLPFLRRFRRGPAPWLLAASLLGWAMMAVSGAGHAPAARMVALCSGAEIAWPVPNAGADTGAAAGHRPGAIAWLAMMLAMAPLLRTEGGLLWTAALPRRRWHAIAAFAAAFATPWLALGIVVLAIPAPPPATLAAGALLVSVWHCAPARQRCLNACHARPSVRAFGPAMLGDAGRWGLRNGTLCAAICGPAMLLATSLPYHLPAMAAAVLLGTIERRRPSLPPAWRLPFSGADALPWQSRQMTLPPRPAQT
ncbi:hypothetical protein [Sphingomonas sp.]|uniref:hypothetical protein n=1 Tax=Sphingomonas sp. TaxID=28214 RepID=UPI002DD6926C|nr:hypothetical protein [Sphingomonas sp.]